MKISDVTDDYIIFDNGNFIEYYHEQDCCEHNYADFKQLEDLAYGYDFNECLLFEHNDYGFRFGDRSRMFFVPCYSEQNGYYSNEIDIRYHVINSNAVTILNTNCEQVLY